MAEPSTAQEAQEAKERSRELTRQANALRAEGRWHEALPLSFEAVRADRTNAAAAHNLGVLLTKVGRLQEGEAASRYALSLAPNSPMIVHALAHALLAQGRYKEGWPLYEVRAMMPELNTGFPRDFSFPRWRGEPLAGKRLAIFPEQGLGDQIQFARFLPRLIAEAGAVTLLTMRALERLFSHNFPAAEIVVADGNVEFPDPDYWITLHDLPGVLGIELDTIPTAPYLRPPGTWPPLGEGFKIGLKTRGNPLHVNDKLRSLPEECAERLRAGLPGTVVSLEPDASGAKDMADTAAIIAQLDLVVSVDTSVAHLAGALGKPCLLLIPGFSPDWRWMFGREDSPWYPGHRLFRSEIEGGWESAVDRLIAAAHERARKATAPAATKGNALADLMHRAAALRDEARFSEALDLMRRAVKQAQGNAGAVNILGMMLGDVGRLQEAEQYLRRSLAMAPHYPGFRNALALNLLAQGRYAEAWPLYEARAEVPSIKIGFPTGMPCPRWRGEPLANKRLTIMPEQGLGDEIQFARFLPWLQKQAAHVTLLTRPALVPLFQSSFPGLTVHPAEGEVRLGQPDYWTTLVDMAQPLGVTLENLPLPPYLQTDRTCPELPEGFRIGLQTAGSSSHPNDAWRSLPTEAAQRLRDGLPGRIVSLDPDQSGARDFADTAALIKQLDLVVSVDTSVAHLAGALGKPCFLLVPSLATDWRWLRDREDSPWYPGHKLYWGAFDGGWESAIARLCADAKLIAGESSPPQPPALGKWRKALEAARQAAQAEPDMPRPARQFGAMLTKLGLLQEGESALRRAASLGGGEEDEARARYELALNLLGQGRYQEAWPFHAARRGVTDLGIGYPQGINGPRWEGQALAGQRLLILAEQGMGDTLQLARFLPILAERGAAITLLERAPLVGLLQSAFPQITVRDVTDIGSIGPQDCWTTTFDMLEPLDVTPGTLPPADYLAGRLPAERAADFRIGFCTAGNPNHRNDQWRSLAPDAAARLRGKLPGNLVDLDPRKSGSRDFAETARIMTGLDLIVSVDTAVAHLAGALGKPCLLLLPEYGTDWRWQRGQNGSPWYPLHRLFWNPVDGNWIEAIDRLAAEAHRVHEERA